MDAGEMLSTITGCSSRCTAGYYTLRRCGAPCVCVCVCCCFWLLSGSVAALFQVHSSPAIIPPL
ncbi:hypothetical protein M431DRAFT_147226 [Trichoderma harzianum CBS 226.95]|uniref:Uncharacterized protein n=1 Tax=Trichoderma harzianum CBS 226.95 TaxID=983964 RepID=A0A2T4A6Y1_TRIHA|nr:hypothetical protein M431DRAFT_147226 [Trichoderma harzianum CBS 226.95]PTB52743.1 hypothetical protein M431DRAFT_147226 [Trichoderma harzianum CBS 226.95]